MTTPPPLTYELAKRQIMRRHLDQLRDLDLVEEPRSENSTTYQELVKWTEDSKKQIQTGIMDCVYGGGPASEIKWDNAFVAFMESAAMYLRDNTLVLRAVETYRLGDIEDAFTLLEVSVKDIVLIAEKWGMKFQMICDLVDKHLDGHKFIVGPFCGAFTPKDFSKPFIGMAFKGTSKIREWINDFAAIRNVQVPKDNLFGARISKGFFYPLFLTYGKKPYSEPIHLIKKSIQDLSATGTSISVTHFTGHSLGAAYGSLSYGQFLYKNGFGTNKAFLGDLYTFGSPRVGEQDFASPFKTAEASSLGSSWRIVNHRDYVPMIPALLISWWGRPWIHIDRLYTVYPKQAPALGPTEIGTRPTWKVPTAIKPHFVTEYYKSLTFATTGKSLERAPALDFLDSQEAVDALGGVGTFKAAATPPHIPENKQVDFGHDTIKSEIVLEHFSKCIRGTIRVGPLIGEIIGWGDVKDLPSLGLVVDLGYSSLRALHATRETRVLINSHDSGAVYINFFLDNVVTAQGYAQGTNNSDGVLVNGTCTWELADTDTVENLSTDWGKGSDEYYEKLFTL